MLKRKGLHIAPFPGIAGMAAALLLVAGCGDDEPTDPGNNQITVPTSYTFAGRFDAAKSGVDYNAETVRNLLINDLKERIRELGEPGADPSLAQQAAALYDHNDAVNLRSTTGTGTLPAKETQYNRLAAGANLKGMTSADQLRSYDKTTDRMVQDLLATLAQNAQDGDRLGTPMAYTTDEGIDIAEFVGTLLSGAISYYQATSVHLNGIENLDNSANNGAATPATAMERAWDAAFGYFGAARDYARYTDALLSGPVADYVHDTDGDGSIDFTSEYNFPFARLAGMRDNGRSTDFTKTIFDAFLTGRATIAGQGTSAAVLAQQKIVRETWEKIIGATLIHYMNRMVAHVDALTEDSGPANSAEMNRDWAAMKALALTLQFNPAKKITDQNLQIVHNYLNTAPQYHPPGTPEYSAYRAALGLARTIIQNAYSFSGADVNTW